MTTIRELKGKVSQLEQASRLDIFVVEVDEHGKPDREIPAGVRTVYEFEPEDLKIM